MAGVPWVASREEAEGARYVPPDPFPSPRGASEDLPSDVDFEYEECAAFEVRLRTPSEYATAGGSPRPADPNEMGQPDWVCVHVKTSGLTCKCSNPVDQDRCRSCGTVRPHTTTPCGATQVSARPGMGLQRSATPAPGPCLSTSMSEALSAISLGGGPRTEDARAAAPEPRPADEQEAGSNAKEVVASAPMEAQLPRMRTPRTWWRDRRAAALAPKSPSFC